MTFIFKKTLSGTTPQYESVPAAAVSVAANSVVSNSSGYADDAGQPTTITIIGTCDKLVDNSGGAAGDLNCPVISNPDAVFEIDSSATITQANMWAVVAITAGGLVSAADTAVTNTTGCLRTRKLISSTKFLGSLIFTGEYA
jgi:hypothetical protein